MDKPKEIPVPNPAGAGLLLTGTAVDLGVQVFDRCAAPAMKHLLAGIEHTLAAPAAAEQILRLWGGFMAHAVGAMVATVGVEASQVLLEKMHELAETLPTDTKGGMH